MTFVSVSPAAAGLACFPPGIKGQRRPARYTRPAPTMPRMLRSGSPSTALAMVAGSTGLTARIEAWCPPCSERREHNTLSHRMPFVRRRCSNPTTYRSGCLFNFIHAIEYALPPASLSAGTGHSSPWPLARRFLRRANRSGGSLLHPGAGGPDQRDPAARPIRPKGRVGDRFRIGQPNRKHRRDTAKCHDGSGESDILAGPQIVGHGGVPVHEPSGE